MNRLHYDKAFLWKAVDVTPWGQLDVILDAGQFVSFDNLVMEQIENTLGLGPLLSEEQTRWDARRYASLIEG